MSVESWTYVMEPVTHHHRDVSHELTARMGTTGGAMTWSATSYDQEKGPIATNKGLLSLLYLSLQRESMSGLTLMI